MKYAFRRIGCLFFVIAMLTACAYSYAANYSFTIDNHIYTVDIPEDYLVYIYGSGDDNALIKMTGNSSSDIDSALKQLDSSVWSVHQALFHQFWLSVKDRSAGLGFVPDGESIPKQTLESYYNGISLGRGSYFVESYNGQDYYIFENGKSVFQNGINYFISTFFGHYEVSLRWESGTGKRTDEDIAVIKDIIHSVHIKKAEDIINEQTSVASVYSKEANTEVQLELQLDPNCDKYILLINGSPLEFGQNIDSAANVCKKSGLQLDSHTLGYSSSGNQEITIGSTISLQKGDGFNLQKGAKDNLHQIGMDIATDIAVPDEAGEKAQDVMEQLKVLLGEPTKEVRIYTGGNFVDVPSNDMISAVKQMMNNLVDGYTFACVDFRNLTLYASYFSGSLDVTLILN